MSSAAPVAVAALRGQEKHTAVAKALDLGKLSDAGLEKEAARFEWARNALGPLTQQPAVSHSDIVGLVGRSVKDGIMPAGEAAEVLGDYPDAADKLLEAVQHRHLFAIHGAVAIAGEQQRRAGAK